MSKASHEQFPTGVADTEQDVQDVYRIHIAAIERLIFEHDIYLDDFLRRAEKYGKPDLIIRSYYAKRELLFRLFCDLLSQEASLTERQDGSLSVFYRATSIAFMAMLYFYDIYNDTDGKAAVAAGLEEGRSRASQNRMVRKAQQEAQILEALHRLWSEGARFGTRGAWSNAVIKIMPHLSPTKDESIATLNNTISKIGREAFGEEWPVRPRGRSRSSQSETNYSGTD